MASVWCAMAHDRKDTKVVGHLKPDEAKIALEATARRWRLGSIDRETIRIGANEIHLVIRGGIPIMSVNGPIGSTKRKIAGHLWIEPCSPPSKPTGGDIYRNAKTKGE